VAHKSLLMKKFFLLGAIFLSQAMLLPAQTDLIAKIHFLGGDKISADANSKSFAHEFTSPEAAALRAQTANKTATWLSGWLAKEQSVGAVPDGAAKLRPLLDDLQKSEWLLQIYVANGKPIPTIAIKLEPSRAELWKANLNPFHASFSESRGWLFCEFGNSSVLKSGDLQIPASMSNWLSADLNWPRLAQLYPALAKFDFPKIQMQVVGSNGELRFTGKLNLSSPLPALAQWQLPATVIHQPFVSFTAARGIAPWLEKQSWAQRYEVSPMPNQFFVWALPAVPFQTFAAAPVPNANAAINQLGAKISAAQNPNPQPGALMMPITSQLTNNEITWRGIPFASPFIKALHEKSGDFLFGGYFPNVARSQPLPQELFAALNQPGLVYYHWETTSNRAPQVLQISQLGFLLTQHKQLDGNSVASKWLNSFVPKLGATVTTAAQTSPTEITFSRRAPGGFTAAEFYTLANWLEAANFPSCDLKLPPHPNIKRRPSMHGQTPVPAVPGTPAPSK